MRRASSNRKEKENRCEMLSDENMKATNQKDTTILSKMLTGVGLCILVVSLFLPWFSVRVHLFFTSYEKSMTPFEMYSQMTSSKSTLFHEKYLSEEFREEESEFLNSLFSIPEVKFSVVLWILSLITLPLAIMFAGVSLLKHTRSLIGCTAFFSFISSLAFLAFLTILKNSSNFIIALGAQFLVLDIGCFLPLISGIIFLAAIFTYKK